MLRIVTRVAYDIVRLLMAINIWWLGVKLYKNPLTAFKVIKRLISDFQELIGNKKLVRAFKIDGRYAPSRRSPCESSGAKCLSILINLQVDKSSKPLSI
ncbi:MAG: hypothetical protein ACI9ZX_003468 [Algoriphagus sp.]|jgi:hypothetical protein